MGHLFIAVKNFRKITGIHFRFVENGLGGGAVVDWFGGGGSGEGRPWCESCEFS
jgi:hypothetical protein